MLSSSRRPLRQAVLAVAVAAALSPDAVYADQTLRLRSGNGSVATQRDVQISSVVFSPGSKTLTVTTRAGNYDCGNVAAPADGVLRASIDGRSYAIETDAAARPPLQINGVAQDQPIVYEQAAKRFNITLSGLVSTSCAPGLSFGPSANAYDLVFDGLPPRAIGETVYFDAATRTFEVRVTEPVLCESYATAADNGLRIALADANDFRFESGLAQVLGGFASVTFVPGERSLRPIAQRLSGAPRVQCTAPSSGAGGGAVPPPGQIFLSGFEEFSGAGGSGGVSLSVAAANATDGRRDARIGDSIAITVTVRNDATAPVRNVRIREYFPRAGGVSAAVIGQGTSNDSCVKLGDNSACGFTTLGAPLVVDAGEIAPGAGYVFTLHRQLTAASGGSRADLGYAAFVDPNPGSGAVADAGLDDNSGWVSVFAVS